MSNNIKHTVQRHLSTPQFGPFIQWLKSVVGGAQLSPVLAKIRPDLPALGYRPSKPSGRGC